MTKNTHKTREQLLTEIDMLTQKLTETEKIKEDLIASNQQLKASEQQLRALNQQLQATEQQLRAANQQLKAAEEQTRIAKENFKKSSLLRNAILESPKGIIVFALDLHYRYLDFTTSHKQTMKEIWGKEINRGDNILDFIKDEADRQKAKANFDRALNGESFILHEEYGDENLKRTFYENRYGPVFDQNKGQIIGIAVYVIDITYRKEVELKLQQQVNEYAELNKKDNLLNEKLSALNQQLAANEQQLRAANQQLEASNRQLKESEKLLLQIAANYPNSYVSIIEKDYTIGFASGQEFKKQNQDPQQLIGLKIEEVFGEHSSIVKEHFKKTFAGQECTFEIFFNNQNLLFKTVPLPGDDGLIHRIVVVTENITDRKQAEKNLELQKKKLADILEGTNAGTWEWNIQSGECTFNERWAEIRGYSLSELEPIDINTWINSVNPDDLPHANSLLEKVFNKELDYYDVDFRQSHKEGGWVWVNARGKIMEWTEDGKPLQMSGTHLDITERKRKEQAQKIIYNISNAVLTSKNLQDFIKRVKDELNTIIDTTNFYIALYDAGSNTFSLLFHTDEKDKFKTFPAGKTLTAYVIKTKKPLLATERITDELEKSGEIELIGTSSKAWLGIPLAIEGKITGVFAVQSYDNEKAYDKSDIDMLEIISRQISISLERKKAEEELQAALEQAQESDRLKSAFLANMSHEIRTPMNGILGFTNLLNDPELNNAERREYTAVINKSGGRLLNTINNLIDISKIEAGQMRVSKTETSINKMFDELLSFFKPEATSKGLSLISLPTCTDKESVVLTDNTKLHGILTNLIKNAIKFTEKGSISFGYSIKDDFIEFFVRDTGIGVSKNRQQAIFNRFEQADNEYSRAFEGSGLGLAIAKAYVEMLGGTIRMVSEEGKGSRFIFTIPYDKATGRKSEPAPKAKEKLHEKIVSENLGLLIAEDEETSSLFLETILKNRFRKITYAKTGKEAVEICKNNPEIDVVLMDVKMPEMNGYEATREIRKFNKDIIIIAQTAFALTDDREKALQAGCDDYISKPIDKEILLKMINRLIKK